MGYIASDPGMSVNDDLETVWMEVIVTCFKICVKGLGEA
jgi:hypothetical protein